MKYYNNVWKHIHLSTSCNEESVDDDMVHFKKENIVQSESLTKCIDTLLNTSSAKLDDMNIVLSNVLEDCKRSDIAVPSSKWSLMMMIKPMTISSNVPQQVQTRSYLQCCQRRQKRKMETVYPTPCEEKTSCRVVMKREIILCAI